MSSIRTPSASTTTVAAGSPATNEYLPHRSDRSTDSRIRPGPSPASAGNSPTGVETSASSSVHTGTSGHWAASESNSSRLGLTCRCGSTVRSFWSMSSGSAWIGDGERRNPGPSARGCVGSRCGRGIYERAGMRLREPRRHVQVIPCICIRRRLCLLSGGGVNDGDGRAAILWNPCASPDRSCRRCVKIPRKQRSRVIVSCSAVGSCGR